MARTELAVTITNLVKRYGSIAAVDGKHAVGEPWMYKTLLLSAFDTLNIATQIPIMNRFSYPVPELVLSKSGHTKVLKRRI